MNIDPVNGEHPSRNVLGVCDAFNAAGGTQELLVGRVLLELIDHPQNMEATLDRAEMKASG